MSLISHSNGFTTKEPKRRFSFKFIFKAISILTILTITIGLTANMLITSRNEDKLVKDDMYVTIDDKKNYYNIENGDAPTIIFESSSGMGVSQWDNARELLKDEYGISSFAYDRDGFGLSDFLKEQTPEEQAKELKLILRKVALNGPFILVSEGYGSLIMTNFAKLYPELVKGIILISPINEESLGNTNYYKYFESEKISRKLNIFGSYLGINNLIDKCVGLDSPSGLDEYLSEDDFNNYKMLRPTTDFNKAYYAELENILNRSSISQVDGMFKDIPYVIVTNNQNKAEQSAMKSLGNGDNTKIIDSNSDSKIIALEKPELILEAITYILNNLSFKESSNT
ncbi:alpha/beta hydrolase [uncultured Clostridium sp.]|uniref:alpha/beta hydrolase n=1 Tax=uncultured Clostridium sp. TaxID=59620 RepID=UPI00260F0973|nr:alpha/beta hydrolase [uncultured Clostridium sp.]